MNTADTFIDIIDDAADVSADNNWSLETNYSDDDIALEDVSSDTDDGIVAKTAYVVCDNRMCRDSFTIPFLEEFCSDGTRECVSDTQWVCRSCGDSVTIENTEVDSTGGVHEEHLPRLSDKELEDLIVSLGIRGPDPDVVPIPAAMMVGGDHDFITPDPDEVPDVAGDQDFITPDPDEVPVRGDQDFIAPGPDEVPIPANIIPVTVAAAAEPVPNHEATHESKVSFQAGTNVGPDEEASVQDPGVFRVVCVSSDMAHRSRSHWPVACDRRLASISPLRDDASLAPPRCRRRTHY